MAPLTVKVPAECATVAAEARVIGPPHVLLPAEECRAPMPPAPDPLIIRGSADTMTSLFICRVAPEATMVPPVAVPYAPELETISVPAFTVVVPA